MDNEDNKINSDDGCVVITGLMNVMDSSGNYYSVEGVKDILNNKKSVFNNNLKSDKVLMEYKTQTYGLINLKEYLVINLNNVCGVIKKVTLEPTEIKSGYNDDVVYKIKIRVKPFGPNMAVFYNIINYSRLGIRGIGECFMENDLKIKKISTLITWDLIEDKTYKYYIKNNLGELIPV